MKTQQVEVYKEIDRLLKTSDKKVKQIAHEVGVAPSYLSALRSPDTGKTPSLPLLIKLAEVSGMDLLITFIHKKGE